MQEVRLPGQSHEAPVAEQTQPAQAQAPAPEVIPGTEYGNSAAAQALSVNDPVALSALLAGPGDASALGWLFSDDEPLRDAIAKAGEAVKNNPGVRATSAAGDLLAKDPADRKAAMAGMSDADYQNLVENLPPAKRAEVLGKLLDDVGPGARQVEMWRHLHKAKSTDAMQAKIDGLDASTPEGASEKAALERALKGELTEADEEADHLKKGSAWGDLGDVRKRKQAELDLEVKWGINLTNDVDETDPAKEPRKRRVWEEKDLKWFENELPKISDKQRHDVTEFRRANKGYKQDASGAWVENGAIAQHWGDSGKIEMFDKALASPGALIHEIGHNVDKNNPGAMARYNAAAGFEDYADRAALEAKLTANGLKPEEIKAKLDGVQTAKGKGGYNDRSIEIDGKTYQLDRNGTTWSSYDTAAIPSRDTTQRTTDGWGDEWDYGRTSPADLFADHYKLAARDPVRLHQDMIDGPQKRLDAMKANGAGATAIALQQRKVDTLKSQWDIVRSDINGVTPTAVNDAADTVPAEDRKAFEAQAARCCTGDQLAKLALAYRTGDQVDQTSVDSVKTMVPESQRAAFLLDAKGCFTQDQLAKLAGAYADRKRLNGNWMPGQAGESTMLGT